MKRTGIVIAGALLVSGLGAAALLGMPMVDLSVLKTGGAAMLPLLMLAGVVDGINPCAFSTLLVFLSALFAYLTARMQETANLNSVRRGVLGVGLAYTAGIFTVYFLAGLGLFGVARFLPAGAVPWVLRGSGLVVILMGLVMIREYFVPDTPLRFGMPKSLHPLVRRYAHATTLGTAFLAGGVIGLCSVPCSGAVYLGVISILTLYGWAQGVGLLLLYNVAFLVPVLVLLFTFTSRAALRNFTHWYLRYRHATKLGLGLFVIMLGFLVIWLA